MTAVINPAKYIAAEVLFYALVDLIHQPTIAEITPTDYDGAAEFFRSGDYVPWCYMADIDPDAMLEHAIQLAAQYRAWRDNPMRFTRPKVHIPNETWQRVSSETWERGYAGHDEM